MLQAQCLGIRIAPHQCFGVCRQGAVGQGQAGAVAAMRVFQAAVAGRFGGTETDVNIRFARQRPQCSGCRGFELFEAAVLIVLHGIDFTRFLSYRQSESASLHRSDEVNSAAFRFMLKSSQL